MPEGILSSPLVHTIGWTLVAFTWQAAIVGVTAAFALRTLSRSDARWRYAVACLALSIMTALPILSAIGTYESYVDASSGSAAATFVSVRNAGTGIATAATSLPQPEAFMSIWGSAPELWNLWLPTIVLVWIAGVTVLSVRLAGGWFLVRRMIRAGSRVDERIGASVSVIALRLHLIRPVRTLESDLVETPTVVGWLRPVILLPLSAIAGLSPEQLEAVIAHELAHVRRHDYAVNMLQRITETLFFYHPAVWWLSNRIRIEREQCADDLAVAACGDATLYAEALRDLEHARTEAPLAMAATGGSLAARIRRLVGQPPARERWSPVWLAGLGLVVLIVGSVSMPESTTAATPPATESETQGLTEVEPQAAPDAGESAGTDIQPPQASEPDPIPTQAEAEGKDAFDVEVSVDVQPRDDSVIGLAGVVRGTGTSFPGFKPPQIRPVVPEPYIASVPPQRGQIVEGRNLNTQIVPFSENTAYLGVRIADGDAQGVVVEEVEPESPAAEAGIEVQDVITELDGMRVVGARQFARMVQETPPGRAVPVTILRNQENQVLSVVLSERPSTLRGVIEGTNRAVERFNRTVDFERINEDLVHLQHYFSPFGNTLRLGLSVENMTPELREFFGAEPDVGVLVTSVDEDSPAGEAGVEVGDVITMAGGNPVDSRSDLSWSAEIDGDSVALRIVRDGSERDVSVQLEIPARSWRIAP